MKVVIVNCFDTYEDRIDLIYKYFSMRGHDVLVIESDFSHSNKEKRIDNKSGFTFIKSKAYEKNMSIKRMISHYVFARRSFKLVERIKPDLLYVILPPNSLAKFADRYKRKYSNVKLCFDIIDLWPEAMPLGKSKSLLPFKAWKQLRDKNIKRADFVITECNLYQSVLKDSLKGIKTETIYLARQKNDIIINPTYCKEVIHLCYLGSINHIIDIIKIKKLIKEINDKKPVVLHIIGDGEMKDIFIKEVESTGATVEYYGKVYDSIDKQNIFDKCHFGLNIMKDEVCVGLSMKSIDYFQAGLPMLNSIDADTKEIIDNNDTGFNVTDENIIQVAIKVITIQETELQEMRRNTLKVFDNLFSVDVFNKNLEESINRMW